jgi:hypothetical protein
MDRLLLHALPDIAPFAAVCCSTPSRFSARGLSDPESVELADDRQLGLEAPSGTSFA